MDDTITTVEDLAEPLTLSTDVYLSEEYARAEGQAVGQGLAARRPRRRDPERRRLHHLRYRQ